MRIPIFNDIRCLNVYFNVFVISYCYIGLYKQFGLKGGTNCIYWKIL